MAGVFDGFAKGVTVANQSISMDRAERQRQLTNYIRGFELQNGKYVPNERGQMALDIKATQLENELMFVKEQNAQLQALLNTNSMTEATTHLINGDVESAQKSIENNPILQQKLREKFGMVRLSKFDSNSDYDIELAKEKGLLPEDFSKEQLDPKAEAALETLLYKAVDEKGRLHVMPTEGLVILTNYKKYVDHNTRKAAMDRLYYAKQILTGSITPSWREERDQIATGSAEMSYQERLATQQSRVDSVNATNEANIAQANLTEVLTKEKLKYIQEALNSGKTYEEIIQDLTKTTKKPSEAQIKAEIEKEQLTNAERVYTEILTKLQKGEKVDLTPSQLRAVRELFPKNSTFGAEQRKEFTARIDITAQMLDSLNKLKKFDYDRNAWEKFKTEASKLGVDLLKKDSAQWRRRMLKIAEEANLKTLVADYIKLMSGAAVTDNERKLFYDIVLAGNYSTKEAMLASFSGFIRALAKGTEQRLDANSNVAPVDYVAYRSMYNKMVVPKLSYIDTYDTDNRKVNNNNNGGQIERPPLEGFVKRTSRKIVETVENVDNSATIPSTSLYSPADMM